MEVEQPSDIPEYIVGQISALKLLDFSDRLASEIITKWGYSICPSSVNKHWHKYLDKDIGNHRENCGRKKAIDEKTKEKMIEKVLQNRWTTAKDLFSDKKINSLGVSVDTI
jgi:hypothetical protein